MRYWLIFLGWILLGLAILLVPIHGRADDHDVTTIVPRILFSCKNMTGKGEGVVVISRYRFTFELDCGTPS